MRMSLALSHKQWIRARVVFIPKAAQSYRPINPTFIFMKAVDNYKWMEVLDSATCLQDWTINSSRP